ncbi:hypothetical protein Acy02nite_71650 [Actinoplanes cyaneus]|uniref:Uncharacterized protein n=1 Tax=Actinoplanes cyaneus TaxID=52696 RepID=A0A919INN0_9ACTN|nr:hypothetical protein Acy02nite_71650 [Actinoplanes cyaneus]
MTTVETSREPQTGRHPGVAPSVATVSQPAGVSRALAGAGAELAEAWRATTGITATAAWHGATPRLTDRGYQGSIGRSAEQLTDARLT